MELSTGSLLASLVVSTIGLGLFVYGKKELRIPQLTAGLAMMIYPYFVGSAAWCLALSGGLLAGLWLAVRAGL